MHIAPQIVVHNLTYSIPNSRVMLQNLTITFQPIKYAIVGDNGSGKSTLMRLIMGEILPQQGTIQRNATLSYCPQQFIAEDGSTVAVILGVDPKLNALEQIQQGSVDLAQYALLGEDWGIAERVRQALDAAGLQDIQPHTQYSHLSGGQKTRLLLAKTLVNDADFILLDEPTNNLDSSARNTLYKFIRETKQGLIIISHDRELLEQMDEIIELTEKGVKRYGGNFSHYLQQKTLFAAALERQLQDAKKSIQRSEKIIQETKEKTEQRKSMGRKAFLNGEIDKLTAGSKKGRSERTQSRNANQEDRIIADAHNKIATVKDKIEIKLELDIDLAATAVPKGKCVLQLDAVTYAYPGQAHNIIDNFNFQLIGPQRVAITGHNGSGKTTLVKLICAELKPCSGVIKIGVAKIAYLDQKVAFLDADLRLIDNFCKHNPDTTINAAYYALAQFGFRNKDAEKLVRNLSGGEKIRAGLAVALMADPAPQLIILDEPTNHLDLRSIECIEAALSKFQGAMLVISHDQRFLDNIAVEKILSLNRNKL